MCVDFYTLDARNLGQAEGAHKVDANVRASKEPTEKMFFGRERSDAKSTAMQLMTAVKVTSH